MTFGHKCPRSVHPHRIINRAEVSRDPNPQDVLLHGVAHPCVMQILHLGEQVPGRQPHFPNGNHRCSAFGSGLDFSTFKDSPKRRKMLATASYSQSKLVSRRPGVTFSMTLAYPQRSRGTSSTLRNLPDGTAIKSSPSLSHQVPCSLINRCNACAD